MKLWPKSLNSYSSILEVKDFARAHRTTKSRMEIRSTVKIVVIDDEKFVARSNLANYGFDITELPDLKSITEIRGFDIILCDLMGVGNNFDRSIGGASIIKEIKYNYPTKFVIAYTGARQNTAEAQAAKTYADDFIKKDADVSKWVEELDDAIEYSSDPYNRWVIARDGLLSSEIDIRKIVEIESAYVDAIKSKDQKFEKVSEILTKADIGGNAKAIVQGLISSAIYAIVFS
jgi:CheY-like chemotaxis protein